MHLWRDASPLPSLTPKRSQSREKGAPNAVLNLRKKRSVNTPGAPANAVDKLGMDTLTTAQSEFQLAKDARDRQFLLIRTQREAKFSIYVSRSLFGVGNPVPLKRRRLFFARIKKLLVEFVPAKRFGRAEDDEFELGACDGDIHSSKV